MFDGWYAQARVQEFVRRGGGQNLKAFFFAFQFFRGGGGAAQKIAEKMIFSTKKVTKYRENSLKFALITFFLFLFFFAFQFLGGGTQVPWAHPGHAPAA